jgi:hypothetical protein
MAKTFKMAVNFPRSIVLSTETIKDFLEAREEARKILAEPKRPLKGESKFRVELLASDKSDDEVLQTIYRSGARRLLREEFVKELCGDESTGRIGDVRIVFEAPPKRTCQGCIVTDCQRPYSRGENVGCDDKRTGVREPGPRWTETV